LKKIISSVIVISMLAAPALVLAQEAGDACMQAQVDAERDVNTTLWFFAGCLFGIFGVGAAYLLEPSPSAVSLVGKSADYVAVYTDCYKDKGRSIQTNKALIGCLTWAGVNLVAWTIYALLASSVYYY
jgi:hypothetical protein